MNVKEQLCQAFCDTLSVRAVPAGLAIGTNYDGLGGDPIGLYVLGPDSAGTYSVQDDGISVATLEAIGADLANKSRRQAFNELLSAYGVEYDEISGDLRTLAVKESEVAPTVLRFIAFMLRLQDLALMTAERAASTFREDALRELRAVIGDRASLQEGFVVHPALAEFPADIGILVEGREPVALFWGTAEAKVYEALLLQAYAQAQGVGVSVVTMLETEATVSAKMRQRAANHLDAMPVFKGDQRQACVRIARQALGYDPTASAETRH